MNLEVLIPERIYHIYNHANGSENLFRDDDNYRYFLQKYSEYLYPVVDTYAYCLMPNHFHFMVQVRSDAELSKFLNKKSSTTNNANLRGFQNLGDIVSKQFGDFFNAYSKAYNKRYDRKGNLFMHRFKRKEISNENYLTQLIAYIHLNPVNHGFVSDILHWKYSSIHAYYQDKESKINCRYLLEWFGDKNALIEFHNNIVIDEKKLK